MPQVPFGSPYGQSPMSSNQQPSPGNLLMAAAIQSQDPVRSMPEGPDRPRLPARKPGKQALSPLKTRNR